MFAAIKKMFSFHLADIIGLIVGWMFISSATHTELFNLILTPQVYLIMFLVIFLFHSWLWLFLYRGEKAYTAHMFTNGIKDFLRIAFASVSMIGVYFLYLSFLR